MILQAFESLKSGRPEPIKSVVEQAVTHIRQN
jgi:hypothetical protein